MTSPAPREPTATPAVEAPAPAADTPTTSIGELFARELAGAEAAARKQDEFLAGGLYRSGDREPTNLIGLTLTPPPTLQLKLDRTVGRWRRVVLSLRPLEQQAKQARDAIVGLLGLAGLERYDSKHGPISLRRKQMVDWEALARAVIAPTFIAQLIPQFTSTGEPYTSAPPAWTVEATK